MRPAARTTDLHTCPAATGTVPHVGGPLLPGPPPRTLIAGLPAACQGDLATCAGGPATVVVGSPTVLIAGRQAARLGDPTAHGGAIAAGCPTVLIGDSGGGAGTPEGQTLLAAAAGGAPLTALDCAREAARSQRREPAGADWIEFELVDDTDEARPMRFVRCRIVSPSGLVMEGATDQDGVVRFEGIESGRYRVDLPDLERRGWELQ